MNYLNTIRAYLNRDKQLLLHISLVLLGMFLFLTLVVYFLPPSFVDIEFSEEVQEDRSPLLDALMRFVSWFGNGVMPAVLTAGTALLFFLLKAKREALFVLLTALSGVVIYGLKLAIDRPRPTEDLVTIIEHAQFQSFPSGHVTFYVVFFGFLTFLMYRLNWVVTWVRWSVAAVSLGLVFSIPISRMYLGAHWFTDVLAGFLVGLLCLIGLTQWYSTENNSPDTVPS